MTNVAFHSHSTPFRCNFQSCKSKLFIAFTTLDGRASARNARSGPSTWGMRWKKMPARRSPAPSFPLKPVVGSPLKDRSAQRVPPPSVKLAAITAPALEETATALPEPDDVDERQLLCAIHVLDDGAKSSCRSSNHDGTSLDSELAAQRALGFLVKLTSSIDGEETQGAASNADRARARPSKATVCAARVLGCLKRFLSAYKGLHRPGAISAGTEAHCCAYKCHQSLVRLAVLVVLFNLSRSRQTARAVVAEGLDVFLLEMAQGEANAKTHDRGDCDPLTGFQPAKSENESRQQGEAAVESSPNQRLEPFDAEDLLLPVDPFDWCFQSLSVDLVRTATDAGAQPSSRHSADGLGAAFLVPLGARTLRCLLDGVVLPTDEVQEHAQRLEYPTLMCGRCTRPAKRAEKQNPRRLPSIFAFPSGNDRPDPALPRSLCFSVSRVGSGQTSADTLTDNAWRVALSTEASAHLALRSLVALALHLPERSPRRRALADRCRPHIHTIYARFFLHAGSNPVVECQSTNEEESPCGHDHYRALPRLPPHQAVAISSSTLGRLAATAQVVVVGAGAQETNEAKDGPSRATKRMNRSGRTTEQHPVSPDSLSHRLKEAAVHTQHELAEWQSQSAASNAKLALNERLHRQRNIRQSIDRLKQLRRSLARGLEILRTGRTHPDPMQSFTDWVQSLPTVESHERARQLEQEMRYRLVLEQQYQLEARRRREHEERVLTAANDCDVSNDAEVAALADKHARFLQVQAELRRLEDILDSREGGDISSQSSVVDLERERDKQRSMEQRERVERARLLQLQQQEQAARERAQMRGEDLYFAKRALRQQEQARRQDEREAERLRAAQKRTLDMQQQKIAEMREREFNAKRAEQETERMRVEELHSRQLRFFMAEQAKVERQHERASRKRMQAEEQDARWRWALLERAAAQREEAERKRQRAEERRARRQTKRGQRRTELSAQSVVAVAGDWVQCWDEGGSIYYYNLRTGVSQWEPPGSC